MGGSAAPGPHARPLSALLDTNVLVRHLTGDPPAQAAKATAFLAEGHELVLLDVIVAELVDVLESVYEVARPQVAALVRAVLAFPAILAVHESVLLRATGLYEVHRIDFAEAYLAAATEAAGIEAVVSFDRSLDRVPTVRRVEPGSAGPPT